MRRAGAFPSSGGRIGEPRHSGRYGAGGGGPLCEGTEHHPQRGADRPGVRAGRGETALPGGADRAGEEIKRKSDGHLKGDRHFL